MLKKLTFRPGVNRDQTNTSGEGGWFSCDKIRFRSGFPEKIGGWVNVYADPILGVCRQMFNYVTTRSDNLVLIGTNKKVYVDFGSQLYDITPLQALYISPDTNNCLRSGTVGSSIVTVTLTDHNATNGNYITFLGVSGTVGGIPASAFNSNTFEISNVTDNTFTIDANVPCTIGDTAGGGTQIIVGFDIDVGPAVTTQLIGWGTGTWGTGTWGEANSSIDALILQRDWWFNAFGDDVIMNYRKGPLYVWYNALGYDNNRAIPLAANPLANKPPTTVMQSLVDAAHGFVIAFGCNGWDPLSGENTAFDPLGIRWTDQNNPFEWEPTDINAAEQTRINGGSQIVRAFQTREEILIWTEDAMYSMKFIASVDSAYSINPLASEVSIMGCRAVTSINDIVYWMGKDRFYVYSGRTETIPCTLRNHVFKDFNYDEFDQVIAGTNEGYNEVWWFYPTADSQTNNAYVIYNYLEKSWYYGYLDRTAWMDTPLRQYPMAFSSATSKVYYHEDSCDADGLPLAAFISSSDIDIDDGQKFTLTRRIIPDVSFAGSTAANPIALITLRPRNFPGSPYTPEPEEVVQRSATIPVEQYTDQVFIRVRARQLAFKISSDGLGVQWQLGTPRIDGKEDGRR